MKKQWYVLALLSLFVKGISGQSFTGDLELYLKSLVDIIPGSSGNLFSPPDNDELSTWNNMLLEVLSGELAQAREKAGLVNYQVTDFEDNTTNPPTRHYVIEEKQPQSHYWGTYVFNRNPVRKGLVIQTPHPLNDTKTGYQGIFCYKRLGAFALFFSGAHRCNHSVPTNCSGTTTVCTGFSEPFRISDNAHNTQSAFQMSTQVVYDESAGNMVFVQLHGFGKLSGDPYLIMSNGTRVATDPDYIWQLKNELFIEDNSLTFKIIHLDLAWTRLTAFTNTQGRYINGSSNPCTQNATDCTGNFIHIEQEYSKLRADSNGWHTMYKALERTFPPNPVSSNIPGTLHQTSLRIYPNPVSRILHIEAGGPFVYSLYNCTGICVIRSYSELRNTTVDLGELLPGIYILRIVDSEATHSRKIIIQ